MVPARLMYGIVPQCLLDEYTFWEDESSAAGSPEKDPGGASFKRIRGYPKVADGLHLLIVELRRRGSWLNVAKGTSTSSESTVEITGLPGRTCRVTRVPLARAKAEFQELQKIAAVVETMRLLTKPSKGAKKTAHSDDEADENKKDESEDEGPPESGARVECDHDGSGEFVPCIVLQRYEDGSYDLEYTGNYAWLGLEYRVPAEKVRKELSKAKRRMGEGTWHWENMTDSEDKVEPFFGFFECAMSTVSKAASVHENVRGACLAGLGEWQ